MNNNTEDTRPPWEESPEGAAEAAKEEGMQAAYDAIPMTVWLMISCGGSKKSIRKSPPMNFGGKRKPFITTM